MKKFLVGLLVLVIVGGIGVFVFRAPLVEMLTERLTAAMFVAEDADEYDPGVAVGQRLPPLLASHQGSQVTNLESFVGVKGPMGIGHRGIALYAIRSVDW